MCCSLQSSSKREMVEVGMREEKAFKTNKIGCSGTTVRQNAGHGNLAGSQNHGQLKIQHAGVHQGQGTGRTKEKNIENYGDFDSRGKKS